MVCNTTIYHPNIDLQGAVCLNILREDWKPVLDINAVIYGLIYLFYDPNPGDPLNHEAADLFRNNPAQVRFRISCLGGAVAVVVDAYSATPSMHLRRLLCCLSRLSCASVVNFAVDLLACPASAFSTAITVRAHSEAHAAGWLGAGRAV